MKARLKDEEEMSEREGVKGSGCLLGMAKKKIKGLEAKYWEEGK